MTRVSGSIGSGSIPTVRAVAREGCRKRNRKGARAPGLLTAQPLVRASGFGSKNDASDRPAAACRRVSVGAWFVRRCAQGSSRLQKSTGGMWPFTSEAKSRAREGLADTKCPRRTCLEAAPVRPSTGSSGGRRRVRARARGSSEDLSMEGAFGSGIARCERSASEERLVVPRGLARLAGRAGGMTGGVSSGARPARRHAEQAGSESSTQRELGRPEREAREAVAGGGDAHRATTRG